MLRDTTIAERLRRLSRAGGGAQRSSPPADTGWQQRLTALEARVNHLESVLEGLQDAVHRQAVREEEHIEQLRRRTEPAQMARDLSRDARRRGL